jgi:hypothetical protein
MGSTISLHIDFPFGELVKQVCVCVCVFYIYLFVCLHDRPFKMAHCKNEEKKTWEVPHLINKSSNRYSQ